MSNPPIDREAVAAELRAHMARKRYTNGDMAAQLFAMYGEHVSGMTISRRMRGDSPLTLEQLNRLCGVLDVDPLDLLRDARNAAALDV